MCLQSSIRDVILMKNFDLLSIVIGALFAVVLIFNLATGNFHLSFSGQPIASQHLWNIHKSMYALVPAVLAGGCRCVRSFWQGRAPRASAVTFLEMLLGAARTQF